MTDISATWNQQTGFFDWDLAFGDLVAGADLESAVLVSLFSDQVAPADYLPVSSASDRRGHFSDTFEQRPIGSLLWLLDKAKFSAATNLVLQARDYCQSALQWLIDDGIAATVDVQVQRATPTMLAIAITITEPVTFAKTKLQYSYLWRQTL